MRWIFALLLLLDAALAGYIYLQRTRPNPDAQLPRLQMNADQIRILPGPPKPAKPAAAMCLEWRSFDPSELARARAALEPLALGERLSSREVAITAGWWVYMPPQNTQAAMEKKASELRDLGVTEFFPVTEPGRWRYAISLGIFRSEAAAQTYLLQLRSRGVRSALVGAREQRVTQTALVIREPNAEESAKLIELSAGYPGTELRAAECQG
ncbi:MAG TPA: SPOR domain-containing protein [Burkholderiales bacterium]|nr:SPOR domain-containing protein [Burkholderiales bacterium]